MTVTKNQKTPEERFRALPTVDLAAAADRIGSGGQSKFALPSNLFHIRKTKAEDANRRRGVKRLIRPENAACVLAALPAGPDDRTHCVLRGDFVCCDMIPQIIAARGPCDHLRIATLGMSAANADTLLALHARGGFKRLTLLVSHYFSQVDKTSVFAQVETALAGVARVTVSRNHAKVICLPTEGGDSFVIEGSANLRSSDNIEQLLIVNDPETLAFHAAWIDEIAAQ